MSVEVDLARKSLEGSQELGHKALDTTQSSTALGFTAVNGHSRNRSHDRSANVRQITQGHLNIATAMRSTASVQHQQQTSWRAADRTDSVMQSEPVCKQSPESAKRKRTETEFVQETRPRYLYSTGRESPKRRMTDAVVETPSPTSDEIAVGLTNGNRRTLTHVAPSSREHTPVRASSREPPPQVRPETEARLAESLALHLNAVEQAAPNVETPSDNGAMHSNHAYSPDLNGDDHSGKRKRNFSNRTKTGCHTCRGRKKKCDETKPFCNNCTRGNFQCGGYGPKPPNIKGPGANRAMPISIQSKTGDPPQIPYPSDAIRYDHWGRAPPSALPSSDAYTRHPSDPYTAEDSRTHGRDSWPRPAWPHGPEPPYRLSNPLPPVDYHQIPTPISGYPHEPAPLSEAWQHPSMPPYRQTTGAGTTISSRESVGTSSSQRAPLYGAYSFPALGQMSEKDKMLLGKPYLHFIDSTLLEDRSHCKAAVERYNNAARPSEAVSAAERTRIFLTILDPAKRPTADPTYRDVAPNAASTIRPGRIGHRTLVETPFNCDYGYNVNLGDDSIVGAGCYMQDPCEIIIGNRVIIGPNVKFYGNTASVYAASRKGSQGPLTGGTIIVEDDVFIGGDAIILPHRTIGKGAVVGAGSVVTENVPQYTVVAGNPAREVRQLGPSSVEDRRMRTKIQEENERSVREMHIRRGYRD